MSRNQLCTEMSYVEIYKHVVHEKQARKAIATNMTNSRLKIKTRYHCIAHSLHNNKKLTGPQNTFDWAACSPKVDIADLRCRFRFWFMVYIQGFRVSV